MQTLSRPPAKIHQTREKKKKYFTLHKIPNHIMAWNAKTEKRAVVAFNREQDVLKTGKIIERHYENRREWPHFDEEELIFEPGSVSNDSLDELGMLNVVSWDNLDELRVFCVEHYFDLLVIETVSAHFQVRGTVFHLDVPMELYVPHLEKLFSYWTES